LLQNAQLHAQAKEYDQAKTLLQQSVSEHPDVPNPAHYFRVMTALYAVCLAQSPSPDLQGAQYAVGMMAQALAGLQSQHSSSPEESEVVMNELAPTYLRVQASLALLQHDFPRARRAYAKLVALNPTMLESWNELYEAILAQHTNNSNSNGATEQAATQAPVESILSSASLPALEVVHACRQSEGAFLQRLELISLAFLALGRVGAVSGSASAAASAAAAEAERRAAEAEKKVADALFKPASEAEEDAEYNDDAADEDVRAKQPATAAGGSNNLQQLLSAAAVEEWPRQSNLNSSRMAAHLLHMDPMRTSSWGVAAASIYGQAVQLSAVEAGSSSSSGAGAAILFSKAIKLLQLHTSLLTSELTGASLARINAHEALPRHAALMSDLCNTQVMLVDSLLRRSQFSGGTSTKDSDDDNTDTASSDLQQATQLLQSIIEQHRSMGAAFPLSPAVLHVLSARALLRQSDVSRALASYRAAIDAQPLALELWEELADVYSSPAAGANDAAALACLEAPLQLIQETQASGTLSIDASHAMQLRLFLRLCLRCYSLRQFDAAAGWAARATRDTGIAGQDSPTAFFLLGVTQAALAHHEQALRALQTALNLVSERRRGSGEGGAPLAAAGASAALLQGLKFHTALLFIRQASAASNATPSAALAEAQALLQEELRGDGGGAGVSGLASAPILFQLALTAHKLKDDTAAQGYLQSALQLRPNNASFVKLQRDLTGAAGSAAAAGGAHPEKWDE
jgi:hypothetical protein